MRGLLARVIPFRHARAPTEQPPDARPEGTAGPSDASRRSLITRGLSIVAGAVGVSAAGALIQSGGRQGSATVSVAAPALATTQAAMSSRPTPAVAPTELSLFVRDVRFSSPGQRPGELPTGKVFSAPHGTLVDSAGLMMGMFTGGVLPGSGGQIAFQRFVFDDGTLIGMGSGSLAGEEYAVVGGTGIYAGAIGTYQTKLQLGSRGSDAEFTFNVTGVR